MHWLSRLKRKDNEATAGRAMEPMRLPSGCVPTEDSGELPGEAGYTISHKRTGLQLVWVPGTKGLAGRAMEDGCFLMGSTLMEIVRQWEDNDWTWEALDDLELPKHPVELSPFWMARTEVTNAAFERFVRHSHYKAEGAWSSYSVKGHEDYPVVNVTWNDARTFCAWAGLDLPTEAQWEWAARGPEGYAYPWGDAWNRLWCNSLELRAGPMPTPEDFDRYIDRLNWEAQVSGRKGREAEIADVAAGLHPVASFAQDRAWCGAMDMAGNAAEWCSDFYDATYYRASARTNPTGPIQGHDRVWRGGCWVKIAKFCRCAGRGMTFPGDRSWGRGFRPYLPAR